MELFHGLPPPRQNIYMVKGFEKNLKEEKKSKKLEDSIGRKQSFRLQKSRRPKSWLVYLVRAIYSDHRKASSILGHLQLFQLQYSTPLYSPLFNQAEKRLLRFWKTKLRHSYFKTSSALEL